MDDQYQQTELCEDLAELFGALPKANNATNDKVRLARELILGLIGDKLGKLRELGLEWG